jgi:hypothetical protein
MILESITGPVNSAWRVWSLATSQDREAIRRELRAISASRISGTANGVRPAQLIAEQMLKGRADALKKRTLALRLSGAPDSRRQTVTVCPRFLPSTMMRLEVSAYTHTVSRKRLVEAFFSRSHPKSKVLKSSSIAPVRLKLCELMRSWMPSRFPAGRVQASNWISISSAGLYTC